MSKYLTEEYIGNIKTSLFWAFFEKNAATFQSCNSIIIPFFVLRTKFRTLGNTEEKMARKKLWSKLTLTIYSEEKIAEFADAGVLVRKLSQLTPLN